MHSIPIRVPGTKLRPAPRRMETRNTKKMAGELLRTPISMVMKSPIPPMTCSHMDSAYTFRGPLNVWSGKHRLDRKKGHCKVDSFLKVEYSTGRSFAA